MPDSTFGIDENTLIEDIDNKIIEFEEKRLRDKRSLIILQWLPDLLPQPRPL